jgi:phenylacetate-CoA ligase
MRKWLARNIIFRVHEWAKGHSTFQLLKEMEAVDRLSEADLQQLQADRLQNLLRYSYAHVPYVRTRMQEAGIGADEIRDKNDLVRLPLLRKADIRKHREALRSDVARKLAPFATGGSTGEPLQFDLSRRRISSQVANRQRVYGWWGRSIGDRELAFWGSPIEVTRQDRLRNFRDRLLSTRLLSAFEMDERTMTRYLDLIEGCRCKQIFGYPSAVYTLCLLARKQGRNLRRLGVKVVFVTSEVLFPYQRELISDTLNCPVANGYGGRDSGFIAHECPQGGMHIMADSMIVEVVDPEGQPVPNGEPGEIIATDLYSHEVPFIRYATGDIGVLSDRRCACGRALPLLESIEGRSNDSIVTPDGRIMNALALVYPLREVPGVEQFRICQKRVDAIHVQIVRNQDFPPSGEEHITRAWTLLFRSPVDVTFEYLPALPRERSGKFRHVVSELAPDDGHPLDHPPTSLDAPPLKAPERT